MKYDTIGEFELDLKEGNLKEIPETVIIEEIKYELRDSSTHSFLESVKDNKKPMLIYRVNRSDNNMDRYNAIHEGADSIGHQDHMVVIWNMSRMRLHPVAAKFVSKGRMGTALVKEAVNNNRKNRNLNKLQVSIILAGFNQEKPIKAKIDTGADMCSLDVNNLKWEQGQDTCDFEFGDRIIRGMACDTVGIRTADGGLKYRPVVEFDVRIPDGDNDPENDIMIDNIQFNLNDRSDMPDKVLVGKNLLKAGKFNIMIKNPNGKDITDGERGDSDVDWDKVQEMFVDVEMPIFEEGTVNIGKVQEAIDILEQLK